jgi:chromosome segregation ATPase
MKRLTILVVLILLGILMCANQAMAARYVTEGEVAQMIRAEAENIASVSASKAQARMMPLINDLSDTLNAQISGVSGQISDIMKEIDLLNQQLGVLQTGITNVQTTVQGTGGEVTNLRLVNEEFQRKVESDLTRRFQVEQQRTDENLASMKEELNNMNARLEKRTVWNHAKTVLEIGMAGLLVYHVLDHDGR